MAGMAWYINFGFYFLALFVLVKSFNVDTHVPIVKEGRDGSYFGFSVTQHRIFQHSTDSIKHVMLVGAPRDNVTNSLASNRVKSLDSPGVVYSCPVSSFNDDCVSIAIDLDDPDAGEVKSGQWLGVSVQSQATDNGRAVACAHRYRTNGPGYDYGLGLCILISNELDEEGLFYEPCSGKPKADGHGQYGLCQAGISVDLDDDGDVLIGSPGPYNWRGAAFKNIIPQKLEDSLKWYQSPVETRLDDKDPRPEPVVGLYSYLGMSSKIGNILGQKTYVTGAPRSKNLGEVLLFKQGSDYLTLEPAHRLLGEQFGSGFGSDLVIIDLDGMKGDDLVVGAPFFHQEGVGGVIYIYMNDGNGITSDTKPLKIQSRKMKESECKALDCSNARFGFSLANLGDIDLDGFQDLAVGAPFEGSGAVYIYRGSEKGIVQPYSQRIAASELHSARPLASFGYSIAGGQDMDDNGYPDAVIGAYNNDKVLLMRSRPVINIDALMTKYPEKIDPSDYDCSVDGTLNVCFEIRVCFKFEAKPIDRFNSKIDVEYRLEAETYTGKTKSRASIKGALPGSPHIIERSMKLHEQKDNQHKCREHTVYVDKNNKDFLNPIFFELTYKLKDQGVPTMRPGDQLPDINSYPVLNQQAAKQTLGVPFVKNCGVDDVCQANLIVSGDIQLSVDSSNTPVLRVGEVEEVRLSISVRNEGEDAHETTLEVQLPKSLKYLNTEPRIGCINKVLDEEDYNLVTCPVGNPLKTDAELSAVFRLDASSVTPEDDDLVHIQLNVNTTSTEIEDYNNRDTLDMKVLIETDLSVIGRSQPNEVFYGGDVLGESAIRVEQQIGPMVLHRYTLSNDGTAAVANSTLWIYWPYEVENREDSGKHLLYLMEEPKIDYPGKCKILPPGEVNPLGIQAHKDDIVQPVIDAQEEEENPEYNTENKRRVKRENIIKSSVSEINGKDKRIVYMDCESRSAKCFKIKCSIGEMRGSDSIRVSLRARLWNHTFVEDYRNVDKVMVSSMAQIEIDPKLNIKQLSISNDIDRATTSAIPDITIREQQGVPLWVIILAVIGGLILLIVLIILLWKCGFFKRKKPEDVYRAKKKKVSTATLR